MYSIADDDCGSRALCGDAVEMLCRQVGFSGAGQVRQDWSRELRSRSSFSRRIVRYIKKRRRIIFAGLLVLVVIGVIAGGLIEVSGRPGPYTSAIDLSYVDTINPIASDSTSLGAQILHLIYHPQGLSRVALTDRISSMVDAAHSYLESASKTVPPYPWGTSSELCTHSLADRYSAVSLFRKGVYGLLGGLYGNSPESASWTLGQLDRARSMVYSSDRLWRDCALQFSRAPGHARLRSSVWNTLQVVTLSPVVSRPINPLHLSISSPSSRSLTGTGKTTPGGVTGGGTVSPTTPSTTVPSSTSTSTTAPASTSTTVPSSTSTGGSTAPHSSTVHPTSSAHPHISMSRSVQVLRWSSAGLNAFVAALAAEGSLTADPSLVISTYSMNPAPLPSSPPGTIDIPPSSSVNLEVVVTDKGNTPISRVALSGSMSCSSCHDGGSVAMVVDRASSSGSDYLNPSGSAGIVFNTLHVSSSGTYRVSIHATSGLPAVSAALQFTLVVGT